MEFQHIQPDHTFRHLRGTISKRLQEARHWRERSPHWYPFGPCGPYQFRFDADQETISFYLNSDFMPDLRWQWADEITNLGHTGWFSDEYGDSETIRGIVFRLPHARGFLAGWSMGEHMATELDRYVYPDEDDAARAADSMAENVAELAREQEQEGGNE